VAAVRLVQDKGTKKLKGTAFVEFEQQSDARAAADACVRARLPSVMFCPKQL
jgi:hypothetical protein